MYPLTVLRTLSICHLQFIVSPSRIKRVAIPIDVTKEGTEMTATEIEPT